MAALDLGPLGFCFAQGDKWAGAKSEAGNSGSYYVVMNLCGDD